MVATAHSQSTRLAAVLLAQQASPEVAAATFRVKPATVRRWMVNYPLADEAGQWSKIEAVLLAQVAEKSARGDARNLVALSTACGIAGRNVMFHRREARAAKLRAQRIDSREQTAADIAQQLADYAAVEQAKDRAGMERVALLRDYLDRELERRSADTPDDEAATATASDTVAVIDRFGSLPADEAAALRAELDAWRAERDARWREQVAGITEADSDCRQTASAHTVPTPEPEKQSHEPTPLRESHDHRSWRRIL